MKYHVFITPKSIMEAKCMIIHWKKVPGNSSFLQAILLQPCTRVLLLVILPSIFHIITLS